VAGHAVEHSPDDDRPDTDAATIFSSAATLRAVRALCALVLLALALREIRRRGPLTFLAPSTVLSNSHPGQPSPDAYLIFLEEAGRCLPRGALVAVVPQLPGELSTGSHYLMALAQMPNQIVVPSTSLHAAGARQIPEWVACFGTGFNDSRFRLVAAIDGGAIYRAVP